MIDLKGLTAVVTGGTGGIGSAIVDKLESFDAKVHPLDRKCRNDLGEFMPDILVTAHAAPPLKKSVREMTVLDFKRVMNTDLLRTFKFLKTGFRYMITGNYGRIINLTSFHTTATYPGMVAYAAAKSGVLGMSRALALELGQYNITVNCVAPGPIRTPRTQSFLDKDPKLEERMIKRTPVGKLGEVEDVANLVAYLASEHAGHITGQEFIIDGGYTASNYTGDHNEHN